MRGRRAGCGRRATPRPLRAPSSGRCSSASVALGKEPVAAPVVVSFEDSVNPAGIAQPACTRCGDCCGGCNVGAKNTVALTYLPDAVRHGAEIFTHAKVRHVTKRGDGGWRVHFERAGWRERRCAAVLTADMVVLAAGTLGSHGDPAALARAGACRCPTASASSFSANGDIIAFGYGAKVPVNAIGVGHPAKVGGPRGRRLRLGPDRDRRRGRPRQQPDHPGGRAALGAGADPAGAVHPQRPAARRAEEPGRRRLQGAVRGPADVLRRVARQRLGATGARGRSRSRSAGRTRRTSRYTSDWTRRWRRSSASRAAAT